MLDVSVKRNFTSLCKMRHTGVGPAIIKLFVSCKDSVRLVIGMTAVQCKAQHQYSVRAGGMCAGACQAGLAVFF